MPYRELTEAGRIGTITGVAGQLLHRGLVQNFVLFFVQFFVSFFKSSHNEQSDPLRIQTTMRFWCSHVLECSILYFAVPYFAVDAVSCFIACAAIPLLARCLVGLSSAIPLHKLQSNGCWTYSVCDTGSVVRSCEAPYEFDHNAAVVTLNWGIAVRQSCRLGLQSARLVAVDGVEQSPYNPVSPKSE